MITLFPDGYNELTYRGFAIRFPKDAATRDPAIPMTGSIKAITSEAQAAMSQHGPIELAGWDARNVGSLDGFIERAKAAIDTILGKTPR